MCDPLSLSIASLAMGAAGSMQQMAAQSAAARQQAQVAAQNQRIANMRADEAVVRSTQDQRDIIQEGQKEEQRQRLDAARVLSAQEAAFAANGLLAEEGTSAGETLIQTREQAELNAQTVRANAQRMAFDRDNQGRDEEWALRAQATNFANEASSAITAGKNARLAEALSAGTSLLSGASKVADKWKLPDEPPSFGSAGWSSRAPGAAKFSSKPGL